VKASLPSDEVQRLEALHQAAVLDTPPEDLFDDLTLLASQICQTPIALISFVDEKRQWFKSRLGLEAAETSRDFSFCAHAILHRDRVLEVCDAQADARFADNPFVTGAPLVRFYAGAPLVTPDGHALGTVCVLDRAPRTLTAEQLASLRALSRHVMAQLEMQRRTRELVQEISGRLRNEAALREQVDQLSANKTEAERLLIVAAKSRRALLSVLEDEKLAGQHLRESEERFRQFAENITKVFWMTDPAMSQMLYVSPAYQKIWGRTCASLYASPRDWLAAVHPEDRERISQAAAQMAVFCDYNVEYRIIRPDQTECWIRDRRFQVRNAAGQVYRIVGTAEDITERKKLEEQFRQVQKMEGIGQLAGGVAHDFNNFLAVIEMQTGLLISSGELSAEQSEYASEINITLQRAASLTRQLLLFSRRQVFQPCELDLNEAIAGTSRMLRRILGENIVMRLQPSPQPMYIKADAGMMDQVLMNLVVNARDAMPKGGLLDVETAGVEIDAATAAASAPARAGSFVRMSVRDNGSGIPPEILSKIFEPFFTTKESGKGTGLGLATVFSIVQQHHGWINVESEVGRGTVFQIYLPRLATMTGPATAQPSLASIRGGQETILLAEDDPSLRVSVRISLTKLGYRVLEASTAAKALEVWNANRSAISLLLTDMAMPGALTGQELAHVIRRENPAVKVLFMSGYIPELVSLDLPMKEGVNFLAKPFPPAKLAQTIRQILDAPA
jgi:PAS domain S-box-containing protein